MSVKIRLSRLGSKKSPFYRIVAANSKSPRDGKFIEVLGTYDPVSIKKSILFDKNKINKWLNNGAKPTSVVDRLLHQDKSMTYVSKRMEKFHKKYNK